MDLHLFCTNVVFAFIYPFGKPNLKTRKSHRFIPINNHRSKPIQCNYKTKISLLYEKFMLRTKYVKSHYFLYLAISCSINSSGNESMVVVA
jgi:hypothetical protein